MKGTKRIGEYLIKRRQDGKGEAGEGGVRKMKVKSRRDRDVTREGDRKVYVKGRQWTREGRAAAWTR